MKSSNLLSEQARRKGNPELLETIMTAKKLEAWRKVGDILAYPRRKAVMINLSEIDRESKEGDTLVIPGKVLGEGSINKKIVIVAFAFSKDAEKKLKEKKCGIVSIKEEMKKNPKAQGIKLYKGKTKNE